MTREHGVQLFVQIG